MTTMKLNTIITDIQRNTTC